MKKRRILTGPVMLLSIGLGITILGRAQDQEVNGEMDASATRGRERTVACDMAWDAHTFRRKIAQAAGRRRGDSFIVQGKIFSAGAIPARGAFAARRYETSLRRSARGGRSSQGTRRLKSG